MGFHQFEFLNHAIPTKHRIPAKHGRLHTGRLHTGRLHTGRLHTGRLHTVWLHTVWLLLVVVAWTSFPSRNVGADESQQIRVLCYNIHYGQGNDGHYDVERLAKVIKATNPDLVALQEVDVGVKRSSRIHEARQLAKLTGLAVRFGPTQHYEGGLFGNAVLTRLPILDVVIHPLPYTESSPERTTYPRGAIAVTVTGPGNKPLRFISTHFQHNVAEDRLAEAQEINRLFASDKITTILAGDMNATPDSAPVAELLTQWTNAMDADAAPTAPATAPRSRIDYIFYRTEAKLEVVQSRVIPEVMASDHRPVFAILQLGAQQ